MKRVLFSMVLLMTVGFTFAQVKNVKEAKSLIEETKPDFQKAQELIGEALTNPETKDDANTWNVAGLIQKRYTEKENEKAYLRQPFDTNGVYNSFYNMFEYFLKCDQLEQIPNEKGKIKFKYRKANAATMLMERPNLINGGINAFNKDDNQEALKFFGMYVDVAKAPMMEKEDLINKDTLISQIAYYAALAAAKAEDYDNVIKYAPMGVDDKEYGKYSMEFLATAYKAKGDTAQWIVTLKDGIQKYPDYSFFFGHLIDYYSNSEKFDEAMTFADNMIAKDPNNPFFLYVKGYLYQNMKDYDNAISFYKRTIEADPTYAEAYSNLGLIYCQQGLDYTDKVTTDFNDPKYAEEQAKIKKFYEDARPYYEKARELKPDQRDLWLNGLYTIYYKLNLGAEFEAIEKLMQ
ncbi:MULTISPECIES: tetratricopeptide repeat protein [unclassified Bacteroides]|jgi:tetratricopeptide (TPR) repeat protein|uniref:tetratricopeptide repeat protein n=1 Tax=unclassified Bacteroides TaxID=2646097 RepID=UPI000E8F7C64|nr:MULTISPECIES: tetratricopeptide repeat protein [unclassified Bacteroides]RGN45028.1 tetratricopeptide repeat protein [Bacteroides sp. OM05-12]RHR72833.1 tetratricopeptide repeat protein [Bacteroides sp. AF16-49]